MIKALSIICLYLVLATATGSPIDDTTTTTRKSGIIIINPATPTRTSRTTQSTTPKPDSEFVNTGISYAPLTVFNDLNLVATGRESVLIYDLRTKDLVRTIEDFSYGMVPFKQNQLILASPNKHISFWNVETGELVRTINHTYANIQAMAINKKQNLLLTGGINNFVVLWDLTSFKEIRKFDIPGPLLTRTLSLAFLEDKNQVIAGFESGNITVWNMYDGSHIRTFHAGSVKVNKLLVDEETDLLYSVTTYGNIREWDIESGTVLKTFTGIGRYTEDLIFSEDNERLISASKHELASWSKKSGQMVTKLNSVSELHHLAINPLNGQLLSTSQNRRLTFWSVKL